LFKYIFSFKNKDKRTRWLYNDETDVWKKAGTASYSDKFFMFYTGAVSVFVFCLSLIVIVVRFMPFQGLLTAVRHKDVTFIISWIIYFLFMIIVAVFVSRFKRSVFLYFIMTLSIFIASDLLISEYDTAVYVYLIYSILITLLYATIVLVIRQILSRKYMKLKRPKKRNEFSDI